MKRIIKKVAKKTGIVGLIKDRGYKKGFFYWSADDEKRYAFYSQFINKGDLCFDVGANVGNRTKIFLKLGARTVAFEPQPRCFKLLESVAKKYRVGKVNGSSTKRSEAKQNSITVLNYALGDSVGETTMHVCDASTISTMSDEWLQKVKSNRFRNYSWDKEIKVKTTTLDSMISKYGMPDFIKIDVEGYEYHVLKGLTKGFKYISFEFTPEIIGPTHDCINYLNSLGNNVLFNYSLGESMELELEEWVNRELIIEKLEKYIGDTQIFGDIYVKMAE